VAELTTRARKGLSKSDFALPGSRSYPVQDKAHAANAKARAKQMLNAGKISRSTYNKIVMAANRVLQKA
jgi:hypothetical protein